MKDLLVVKIAALEHFSYCPRQCALIHLDGVWEENRHTVLGERGHRRVDSGESRKERGRVVLRSIPLWSENLGLSGRADAIEINPDGRIYPVEYKIGRRHGLAADIQICAQALCLEEMLGRSIAHGFVWYSSPRRRVRVDLDSSLRRVTLEAIKDVRDILTTCRLPQPVDDARCWPCQLVNHCLPQISSRPGKVIEYIEREVLPCDS